MKYAVLHLSTSHTGGAGIAARNLSAALNSAGIPSAFLAIANPDFFPEDNEISADRGKIQRLASGLNARFQRSLNRQTYFTLFSVPVLKFNAVRSLGGPESLILHIHNWFNLLDFKTMQKLAEAKYNFVFTLHDMRLFTGGCHYSLECNKYLHGCIACPKITWFLSLQTSRNLKRQKNFLQRYSSQIKVIAPSRWLTSIAAAQLEPLGISVAYVPNFHPEPKVDCSSPKVKLRGDHRLALGIASLDPNSYLKGGDLLPEIQKIIQQKSLPVQFIYLRDFENSPNGSSRFWKQVDYLLVLSRADNSPNVIHEARINGVKVLGTNVGGITELLIKNFDVPITLSHLNPTHIVNVIENLISSQESQDSVEPPKFNYSEGAISGISEVYSELLQS